MKNKPHILLVEDDPNDQLLIKMAFRRAKVTLPLTIYDNADEALIRLCSDEFGGQPMFVLTDLKMPNRDGFSFISMMRGQDELRAVPIIVLSTSDAQKDIDRAYRSGCNAYHTKPMGMEDLVRLVKSLLAYWTTEAWLPCQ